MNPVGCIRLKKGKERSVLQFHPWVFSGAVALQDPRINEGDPVEVLSYEGKRLAIGHFHKGTITVRCFHFGEGALSPEFWKDKIDEAYSTRKNFDFERKNTNAYRLVHGEGDGLPGLIVDIYGETAVVQCHTLGMYRVRNQICESLLGLQSVRSVYNKSEESLKKLGFSAEPNDYLHKEEKAGNSAIIHENGHLFSVDWVEGQKTGFFLDQRENRQLVAHYSQNRNVLNTFCYSGGFSVYALKAGASSVCSVDSSRKAIELTDQNIRLNGLEGSHHSVCSDTLQFLRKSEDKFDLLILDPPAYAKHLNQTKQAIIGYRNLNTEGLKKVRKGGILFTFSCSQAVDSTLFRKILFQSALQAGRSLRIIHQLSQGPDHPVSIFHPEGEYLKGLVVQVD